jgi:hypothetical protein
MTILTMTITPITRAIPVDMATRSVSEAIDMDKVEVTVATESMEATGDDECKREDLMALP